MLSGLSEQLDRVMQKLRGRGRLTEAHVKEAMREIRVALLEADVNFKVVKDFVARVGERAVGEDVLQSLTPGQQVVKIVHEELAALMGEKHRGLEFASHPPTVIAMAGLQGSGKTTSAAKLAAYLKKNGRRPLLVAADVHRPAAIDQLESLGAQIDVPVYSGDRKDPVAIGGQAVSQARTMGLDTVIVDTAGRLQVDEAMMAELSSVAREIKPHERLLVVDAMTGQEAVSVAESFSEHAGIDGVILTKMDGDARGGAALSILAVTGCPVKFIGVGEKVEDLEPFHPERMASRILGMGDVLSLIERAQSQVDAEKATEMERKLREDEFTLEDFRDQLGQVKNMGSLEQLMSMMPGMSKRLKGMEVDDRELVKVEAIIDSMTPGERRTPEIINGSRRRRIATGSGTRVQDVNRLLKQFKEARKMIRQLSGMGQKKGPKGLKGLKGFPF